MRLGKRGSKVFAAAFSAALIVLLLGIDRSAGVLMPKFEAVLKEKKRLDGSGIAAQFRRPWIVPEKSANKAKAAGLFWMGNIEGAGTGIDVLGNSALLDQLFPGYGEALFKDHELWREYFEFEFGPDSFLSDEPELARNGFRVAYSWAGCFAIYKKYSADVLVLGSSETYKDLIPGQLSNELASVIGKGKPPRVLICSTHGMPVEVVTATAGELLRLSAAKPKVIIWGYSFWMAYLRSQKLTEYQTEIGEEYSRYRKISRQVRDGRPLLDSVTRAMRLKVADFFPTVKWDSMLVFSLNRAKSLLSQAAAGNHEGVYLSRDVLDSDNAALDDYLNANLKPYYSLVEGISEADCRSEKAARQFDLAVDELRRLSSKVFVYIPPTTQHQRQTVPTCFLPSVVEMLKKASKKKDIVFFEADAAAFGLRNRDFIYPTLDPSVFYFDINHTNFEGSRKITSKISNWIRSTMIGATAGPL